MFDPFCRFLQLKEEKQTVRGLHRRGSEEREGEQPFRFSANYPFKTLGWVSARKKKNVFSLSLEEEEGQICLIKTAFRGPFFAASPPVFTRTFARLCLFTSARFMMVPLIDS